MNTHEKGRQGEETAVAHLVSIGYTIVQRNFKTRYGEIDCIARDQSGTLVFVEVKSAHGTSCGHPMFWVTRAKQRQLVRMAIDYRSRQGASNIPCRFDIVAVRGAAVDHIKNAFLAG